ncbi:fasciclin domain-containing protein [Gillisia sp. M10.2A]|uniref:Fasciclin domain-containing protein n=1 Tax=Gillisia lutea TaxID=2909668 RepID=A0ABS9EEC6_9FLAO|nr:fasciclin domain-containing protein [Gillisia lutea]MCF4101222.1 fasciclin domain-containing protein [Gillisia lutea]
MKNLKFLSLTVIFAAFTMGGNVQAQTMSKEATTMVGGAAMYPSKNIVENAVNSKDHTTLVAAVKAADLVEVLQSEGPFTVFAPVNAAFNELPAGTIENLLKPENKETLQAVLTYHVVAGNFKAADIMAAIKNAKGTATFKTVQGVELKAMMDGKKLKLMDAAGNVATVTIGDVNQSNGVIHVIDTVLLPTK